MEEEPSTPPQPPYSPIPSTNLGEHQESNESHEVAEESMSTTDEEDENNSEMWPELRRGHSLILQPTGGFSLHVIGGFYCMFFAYCNNWIELCAVNRNDPADGFQSRLRVSRHAQTSIQWAFDNSFIYDDTRYVSLSTHRPSPSSDYILSINIEDSSQPEFPRQFHFMLAPMRRRRARDSFMMCQSRHILWLLTRAVRI
jgi:hypothetical protein